MISLDDQLKKNQQAFARNHSQRIVNTSSIAQNHEIDIYACSVRHNFIKPQWYRANANLKDAGISSIVKFICQDFGGCVELIKASLGEQGYVSAKCEERLSVGGALAYTDPSNGDPAILMIMSRKSCIWFNST